MGCSGLGDDLSSCLQAADWARLKRLLRSSLTAHQLGRGQECRVDEPSGGSGTAVACCFSPPGNLFCQLAASIDQFLKDFNVLNVCIV